MTKLSESEKLLVAYRRKRLSEWFVSGYPVDEKSYISQLVNGKVSFGSKAARRLEESYGMPKMYLDSHIPAEHVDLAQFDYLDASAACGNGYINHDMPATVTRLEMGVDFAQELVGSANKSGNIKLFTATGDSMVPTISPRDLLFVDTACQDMRGEGIYLVFHADGLACKRLVKIGKNIRVCSDNPVHKNRDWDWTDRDETTRIVGKVVASLPLAIRRHE